MEIEGIKLIVEWEKDENNEFYIKPENFETENVKGFVQPIKKLDGILLFNNVINLSDFKNFTLRNDDTFIIGFPKSGTTWIEELAWQITHNMNFDQAEALFHFVRVIWMDRGFSQGILNEMESPRCFKSHSPIKFLPNDFNKRSKVVYVIRNPKDVVVSTYFFLKSMKENIFTGTLDDMVDLFVEGKTLFGPWWEHLNQYENLENVHIIHYEELLENPIEIIKGLCKYLGKELSEEDIKKLLAFTSFDNMKKMPSMDMKMMEHMFTNDLVFFNKGQIGNWKNHLTEEQSKKIDEMVKTKLTYKKPLQYEPSKNN